MRFTSLVVATLCFILQPCGLCASGLASLAPGTNDIRIVHDGESRRLLITTPETFVPKRSYPVLFCFHGAGGKADGPGQRWSPHADKRGLIVISAEAVQPLAKWNFMNRFHAVDHNDVDFVTDVTKALIALSVNDLCVGDIAAVVGLSLSATSTLLKQLRSAGFLTTRSAGKQIYYQINSDIPASILEVIFASPRK